MTSSTDGASGRSRTGEGCAPANSRGTDAVDGREHLELRQCTGNNETFAMLVFHPDGTLAYVSHLMREETHSHSLFDRWGDESGRPDVSQGLVVDGIPCESNLSRKESVATE